MTAPLTGTAVYSFYRYYGFLFSFFFVGFEFTEFTAVVRVDAAYSDRRLLVVCFRLPRVASSGKGVRALVSGEVGWSPTRSGVLLGARRHPDRPGQRHER